LTWFDEFSSRPWAIKEILESPSEWRGGTELPLALEFNGGERNCVSCGGADRRETGVEVVGRNCEFAVPAGFTETGIEFDAASMMVEKMEFRNSATNLVFI
jgi:hypothetical protein